MNQLQVFNFNSNNLRTVDINDQPWFVLKDVCEVLSLSNPRMVKERLSDDVSSTYPIPDALGRVQDNTIINEDGLYDVILESRKPEAREFRKWITKDVLPSIRKTGMYATDELLANPDLLIAAATELKRERAERQRLESQSQEDAPKVAFANAVAGSHTSILVRELATIMQQNGINIGEKRLFTWLRENGYVVKRQGTDYNMPTQKSVQMGLLETKETVIQRTNGSSIQKTSKVTGKGQQYFIEKIREVYV
ncbi:phage antirepressor [Paenibacillus nicotianae]|uniref:Phage antirepressor n=1 Tax=Paenibacillus nicotianae TaxID=1526551 RepID=A0ABW4USQ1_9BACL